MTKALTAACAVTILVALSAQAVSAATAAEQPVQASGEATEEMREANEAVGLTDDTVITRLSATANSQETFEAIVPDFLDTWYQHRPTV